MVAAEGFLVVVKPPLMDRVLGAVKVHTAPTDNPDIMLHWDVPTVQIMSTCSKMSITEFA